MAPETFVIHVLILLPVIGFVVTMFIPVKEETLLSRTAFFTVGLHMIITQGFIVYWIWNGSATIDIKDLVLFQTPGYEFFLDFNFDKISAVYLFVGSLLTFLVTTYSRYYLHREEGYRRFFNAILSFYVGYNVAILAGNLET